MTFADLATAWPVLASLFGAVAVSAVAVSRASGAVETARKQAEEIVALREAAAANRADHVAILAQLERLQDSVDRLRPGR